MINWLRRIFGGSAESNRVPTDGVYSGLRHQALITQRAEVGIAPTPSETPVWGILMETGYPGATATLFALSDGTTSLYLSSGGGVIGGHAHESVRQANAGFIEMANQCWQCMTRTEDFPVPATGQTTFYVLTDSGILTTSGSEEELGYGRHPLAPLFHAGHEVITQLRLISESAGGDA